MGEDPGEKILLKIPNETKILPARSSRDRYWYQIELTFFLFLLIFPSTFLAGYGYGAPAQQVPTATPAANATEVPPLQRNLPVAGAWQRFEVEAHGLTISYPPGWLFVEPTAEDPTALLAGSDLPFLAEALRELLPVPALRVDAGLVGLGFQLHPRKSSALAVANNISVDVVPAEGATLHKRLQSIAFQLRWVERLKLDRVEVVTGLRPQEEAAGSMRFRGSSSDSLASVETEVWIAIVESADSKAHLVLRFETLAAEFASLEPLLTEIVRRVRWDGQPSVAQPASPAAAAKRTTGIRSGPGEGFPVIGWASGGLQLALIRPDPTGDWWLAAYMPAATPQNTGSAVDLAGQLGWVSAQAVTAVSIEGTQVGEDFSTPNATPAVPVVKLSNPFASPADRIQEDRPEVDTSWTVFEERGRQLSIFYPEGWIFFEADQPTPADLADLSAALWEQVTEADIGDLVPGQFDQSRTGAEGESPVPEPTVWVGFQRAGMPDNVFLASYTSVDGLTLEQLARRIFISLYTNPNLTLEIESAGMVSGLRPGDEEAISVRYRTDGLSDEQAWVAVWQVVMLSPDSESIFALDFFIGGEEFAALEPLLREIVWRMRWEEQLWPESLAGPAVSVGRTMNVRGGPGTDYPVMGTAIAGQRFPIVGQNSAGDWWQIYYDERLGWIYGGLVTATGDREGVRRADPSGWLAFDYSRANLNLSFPSEWFFFDPSQPAPAELAAFSAEVGARVDASGIAKLVSQMTDGQGEAVVGLGLQVGQSSSNFTLALAYEAGGVKLQQFAELAATELEGENGVAAGNSGALGGAGAAVELVNNLREGEEVVAIRLREDESLYEGLQFWLLSADGETLLILASSILGQEMSELGPVLEEMVRRLRWTEPAAAEPPAVPLLTVDRAMEIRRGPAKIFAVMGTAEADQQLAVVGRNYDGSWWQINYQSQSGWVFGQDLAISDAESVPVAAGVPTPTPTPTATPAPALTSLVDTPEHMAYLWWHWGQDRDSSGDGREGIRELTFDFTIHTDPGDFSDDYGLYLMLCYCFIGNVDFYFGLQTDVVGHPENVGGKGLIFSRWETRDLANARVADSEEGWVESAGHEGDFIGVRRRYNWGAGEYRVSFAPDGADSEGEWFGVWITDKATYETTWIGSLKFPYENGRAAIGSQVYTNMEIYGGSQIQAFRIPEWHVSLKRPLGDGLESGWFESGYAAFGSEMANADVRYDRADGEVHIVAGGVIERTTPAQVVKFD